MKLFGRGRDLPPVEDGATASAPAKRGRRGKGMRRLISALLLLGLLAALTRPGRRASRVVARWIDSRVEFFTEPSSDSYNRFVVPILGHLYDRVADDTARELKARNLTGRPTIVDLGCGTGDLVVAISHRARDARIVGIDVSPVMLQWAGRHATTDGRLRFMVGDAANLPFDDATVDVVVSTLSLHHWTEPADALAEIARVLRPGGVALIYDLGLLTFTSEETARLAVEAGLEPGDILRERARGGFVASLFVRYKMEGLA